MDIPGDEMSVPDLHSTEIVACDVEGTLSDCEAWRGMRAYLEQNGRGHLFRRFLFRNTIGLVRYRFGWIDDRVFKEKWILRLLSVFEGFTRDEMQDLVEFIVETEVVPNVRTAVRDELRAHQAAGRRVVLVTGMIQPLVAALAARYDGIEAIGTPLEFDGDVFTGRTAAPLNVRQHKVDNLRLLDPNGQIAVAYGDTSSDIPMLSIATRPVAVHPDPALRETAVGHGWRILE